MFIRALHRSQSWLSFLGKTSWFTIMLCVSISNLVNSCTRRSVSYRDRNSAMHTHTNVVRSGFLNCLFTSSMTCFVDSSFSVIASWLNPPSPNIDVTWLIMGAKRFLSCMTFSRALLRLFGRANRRSVCPVGAVSKTMTSYSMLRTSFMTSAKPMASSIPGMASVSSCIIDIASTPPMPLPSRTLGAVSPRSMDGSISMANKLSKPLTLVGSLVNFCVNASLRLCAGSVEISSTLRLTLANWIPKLQLQVVLPTPPFPPTKIHLRVFCSRIFLIDDSGMPSMLPSLTLYFELEGCAPCTLR
eukprot:Colp12_sorted_trinity150504_noHs@7695